MSRILDGGRLVRDPQPFHLSDDLVEVIGLGDFYRYLGVREGYQPDIKSNLALSQAIERIERLFKSSLTPDQKLIALRRFEMPRLTYLLRLRRFPQVELKKVDRTVRRCVRLAYRLPVRTCTAFFHSPCGSGGLGIPSLASEGDILTVTQAYKMLTAPDGRVVAVARGRLEAVALGTASERQGISALAAFLSGGPALHSAPLPGLDLFVRTRQAAARLGLKFTSNADAELCVTSGGKTLAPRNRCVITRTLHQQQNARWRGVWASNHDQGKTVSAHTLYAYSNNWVMKTGALNIAERRFAMKSRLNLLPVKKVRSRFNKYPQPNLRCCRCGHTEETLPHVLNHCKPVMEQILRRHDRIMGEVLSHIPQQRFTRISVDEVCLAHAQQTGENLRPDVILEQAGGISVVDFACPFDNGADALELAATRKVDKYRELCENLARATGKRVSFHTYIIGSLGSYAKGNSTTLAALGIAGRLQTQVARNTCNLALKGSHEVWQSWCRGIPTRSVEHITA